MLRTATAALRAAGHTVVVSDLYAMGFDPVSDRRNFTTVADTTRLRQQAEEAHAYQEGGFAPALHTEMDKLAACDLLILLFPIWWLGLPAILKGWVDRVFAVGVAYGGGRCFGSGVMRGKRAMCVLSTGACPLRTTARVTTRRSRPCCTRCIAASSSSQGSTCCRRSWRTAPIASMTASAQQCSSRCALASPISRPLSRRPLSTRNERHDHASLARSRHGRRGLHRDGACCPRGVTQSLRRRRFGCTCSTQPT